MHGDRKRHLPVVFCNDFYSELGAKMITKMQRYTGDSEILQTKRKGYTKIWMYNEAISNMMLQLLHLKKTPVGKKDIVDWGGRGGGIFPFRNVQLVQTY